MKMNLRFLSIIGLIILVSSCKEDSKSPGLTASFNANPNSVYARHYVKFTDTSPSSPTSWSWTFDGGLPASSTQQNPIVFYATPGSYSVSMTITNGGSSGTESKSNFVEVLSNPVPTDGLVLEYTFENEAEDTGPKGLDGIISGAQVGTNHFDEINSAYAFNGVEDEIIFPHTSDLESLPISISFWIKFDELNANILGTDKGDGLTARGIYFSLGKSPSNLNHLAINFGNGGGFGSTSRLTLVSNFVAESGIWYHVVGIVEESHIMHIYVNGSEKTGDYSGTASTYFQSTESGILGATCNPSDHFSGSIDQFRIYSHVLTSAEIQQLYEEK